MANEVEPKRELFHPCHPMFCETCGSWEHPNCAAVVENDGVIVAVCVCPCHEIKAKRQAASTPSPLTPEEAKERARKIVIGWYESCPIKLESGETINRYLTMRWPDEAEVLIDRTASALMAVTPSQLQSDIDKFWFAVHNSWDIEPREYFEKEARKNGFDSPLAMAVHYMWKREVKASPSTSVQSTEDEIRTFQDGIRDHLVSMGVPEDRIDGAGCDSGDPLDFTKQEISQAFDYFAELSTPIEE